MPSNSAPRRKSRSGGLSVRAIKENCYFLLPFFVLNAVPSDFRPHGRVCSSGKMNAPYAPVHSTGLAKDYIDSCFEHERFRRKVPINAALIGEVPVTRPNTQRLSTRRTRSARLSRLSPACHPP